MLTPSSESGTHVSESRNSFHISYDARATHVDFLLSNDQEWLVIRCADGRELHVPLAWFPLLAAGTSEQRAHYHITGDGRYIHWPDLDEDIEVEHLFWTEQH